MHLCGRRAFLRTEYVRRALRTAERIVHVAGHVDARAGQPGVESMDIDGGDPRQRAAAGRQAVSFGVQQPRAQRGQHACAGVVGGGAAQAQDDVARAGVERGQDQLAHAVAAGAHRISARRRDQLQAGSGGHFDDGRAVRQHAPDRVDRPSASFTVCMRASPEAAASTASTVPSPPSAMGTQTVCAPGIAAFTPRAMASAAAGAEMLSLNESGAMTIFTMRTSLVRIGGVHDTRALASRRTIAFPLFLAR